ncbi:rho GTPase-activating protein 24-like [Notothenia coriiceps]|uniref:Rho GTPase-activating protein 24-like n=1 Tax=Notothenia coriiceps TaxID=8208 RepID=A0A6I9PL57_9TELE|nr:PREDICTED: rho GTPase-activating protein 24-like [Notothenia coriiceps]
MDEPCVSHSSPQRSGGQAGTEVQRQGRPSVIRCGWLRKQGGFVKTWHSRWFVLRGDQLHYYKDEEETKAMGAIFLPGNKVTEHPTSGDEGGKFLFEIISVQKSDSQTDLNHTANTSPQGLTHALLQETVRKHGLQH